MENAKNIELNMKTGKQLKLDFLREHHIRIKYILAISCASMVISFTEINYKIFLFPGNIDDLQLTALNEILCVHYLNTLQH